MKKIISFIVAMLLSISFLSSTVIAAEPTPEELKREKAYHKTELVSVDPYGVKIKLEGGKKGQFYFEPLRGVSYPGPDTLVNSLSSIPHLYHYNPEKPEEDSFGFSATNPNRLVVDIDLTNSGDYTIHIPVYFTLNEEDTQFMYGFAHGIVTGDNDPLSWPSTQLFEKVNSDFMSKEEAQKGADKYTAEEEKDLHDKIFNEDGSIKDNPDIIVLDENDEDITKDVVGKTPEQLKKERENKPKDLSPAEPRKEEIKKYVEAKDWKSFTYNEFDHLKYSEETVEGTNEKNEKITYHIKTHELIEGDGEVIVTTKDKKDIPDKIELKDAKGAVEVLFEKSKEEAKEATANEILRESQEEDLEESKERVDEQAQKDTLEKAKDNTSKETSKDAMSRILPIVAIVVAVAGVAGLIYLIIQKTKPKF